MASDPAIPTQRPRSPSLVARLADWSRSGEVGRSRGAGMAVAALLLMAPLATWAGAVWTSAGVRRDTAAIRVQAAPRLAALAAQAGARRELERLLGQSGPATTLDTLARTLPRDAVLTRAGRGADGRLALQVLATDPDRLRAALRRTPVTARLRDTAQSGGAGGMVVTLEEGR